MRGFYPNLGKSIWFTEAIDERTKSVHSKLLKDVKFSFNRWSAIREIFNSNQLKNIFTFFTFYIALITYYYYSNKKNHYKTNFFTFVYKKFENLYYINHFLLPKKKPNAFAKQGLYPVQNFPALNMAWF